MPNNWLNNRKRRPTHPGEILRRPVTTDIAHRLSRAFGTSPEMWLGLQQDVDLWDTHHARRAEYEKIKRVARSKAVQQI